MKTDSFAQTAPGTRCDTHRALVAARTNGIENAVTGVLAGDGITADEFADLQPDRGVAR